MDLASQVDTFSAAGLAITLAGSFLLSAEAIRLVRLQAAAKSIHEFIDLVTSSLGKRKPLPLRGDFALGSLFLCILCWLFAPWLFVFTVTPTLFVLLYLVHRCLTWIVAANRDGFVAVVGFLLLTIGTGLQLVGALL